MWIENGLNQSGVDITHVYGFSVSEMRVLIAGIPKAVKKLEKNIEKIYNNPKNEGQVTYSIKIRELDIEINCLKHIETTFLEKIEKHNSKCKKGDRV